MSFRTAVGLMVALAQVASPCLGATPESFSIPEISAVAELGRTIQSAVTSRRGHYVAWIDQGDLLIAREPGFKREILVPSAGGEAVVKVHAAPDGRAIFYVRGSLRPAFGSVPARDTRELWRVETGSAGASQLIASGVEVPSSDVVFAPGGNALAFAEGNVLYEFRRDVAGSWARRQLLQPDARHVAGIGIVDVVYSPDGERIAFVSKRKARQSYVVVHDISREESRYVEPGIFADGAPVWSPDGRELAFVRVSDNWTMRYRFTPEKESELRTPARTGVPWSILAVDVRTGAVRKVWQADPGPGSVVSSFAPLWTADGRILFSWEKTGWNLLYSVPASGGVASLLTPGQGEVGTPTLSADGRTLVYDSNIGDLGRRHVWTLTLNGGTPKRLDSGKGVERGAQVTAGGYIVYRADYVERGGPPRLLVRGAAGESRAIALQSNAVEERNRQLWARFQPEEVFTVQADDGLASYHVAVRPRTSPPPGGYPVVIHAHGGPAVQTTPGTSPRGAFGQYLASRGYLYIDINYRGSLGFGLEYRLPQERGATGGSEVIDLAALARHLRARGDVDARRIGIMGGSYGGHIVGLAMSRLPDDFAVGVSLFGVSDWVVEMKKDEEADSWGNAPPRFIRLSQQMRIEELAYESSPSAHLDRWRGATLLTEGDLDQQGHMESTIDLGYRLLERGVPVEFHIEPAGGHNVFSPALVFAFFEKHLR